MLVVQMHYKPHSAEKLQGKKEWDSAKGKARESLQEPFLPTPAVRNHRAGCE